MLLTTNELLVGYAIYTKLAYADPHVIDTEKQFGIYVAIANIDERNIDVSVVSESRAIAFTVNSNAVYAPHTWGEALMAFDSRTRVAIRNILSTDPEMILASAGREFDSIATPVYANNSAWDSRIGAMLISASAAHYIVDIIRRNYTTPEYTRIGKGHHGHIWITPSSTLAIDSAPHGKKKLVITGRPDSPYFKPRRMVFGFEKTSNMEKLASKIKSWIEFEITTPIMSTHKPLLQDWELCLSSGVLYPGMNPKRVNLVKQDVLQRVRNMTGVLTIPRWVASIYSIEYAPSIIIDEQPIDCYAIIQYEGSVAPKVRLIHAAAGHHAPIFTLNNYYFTKDAAQLALEYAGAMRRGILHT